MDNPSSHGDHNLCPSGSRTTGWQASHWASLHSFLPPEKRHCSTPHAGHCINTACLVHNKNATQENPKRHHRDSTGTPPGHYRDTTGTPPGHHRDTTRTPPGHHRDTTGTPPGHHRDNTWGSRATPCRDCETSPGGTGSLGSFHGRLPRPDMFEHPPRLTKQMNCL